MIVAPSLFAASAANFSDEIRSVERAGAQYLHIDVMDGSFVPNLSFGPNIVESIRNESHLYFDVHLMIHHPENFIEAFIKAGANAITLHYEAVGPGIEKAIAICRKNKIGFGLALKPQTPVEVIIPWASELDLLLIMSIHPGFGGQDFMPEALCRITRAKKLREAGECHYLISVDGGVQATTGAQCKAAGADVLVAGTYIFSQTNREAAVRSLM